MTERQAPYSPDRAQALHDQGLDVFEEIDYIERQLAQCLEMLEDPDIHLDHIEDRYADLARKLRSAADQLDPQ